MKKIVAIGGSNSKKSINKQLASYVANRIVGTETIVADLNDFKLPLYGIDEETDNGIPETASKLNELIGDADGLVVSLAEHNGAYAAAFKNAFDWLSRIDQKVWKNKPMLLMATSPGARGGASVLQTAVSLFPFAGANIVASFSLPSFYENFSNDGLKDKELNNDLNLKIKQLKDVV